MGDNICFFNNVCQHMSIISKIHRNQYEGIRAIETQQTSGDKSQTLKERGTKDVLNKLFVNFALGFLVRNQKQCTFMLLSLRNHFWIFKKQTLERVISVLKMYFELINCQFCKSTAISFSIQQMFSGQYMATRISGRYAPLILTPAEGFSLEPCTLD
jgi:hypothetical protein